MTSDTDILLQALRRMYSSDFIIILSKTFTLRVDSRLTTSETPKYRICDDAGDSISSSSNSPAICPAFLKSGVTLVIATAVFSQIISSLSAPTTAMS